MSDVLQFGAVGDGKHDDTKAIQHLIDQGEGVLHFPRGDYLITKTIEIDTTKVGRLGVSGSLGTAKIIMAGAGPALRLAGSHGGTAAPQTIQPEVWRHERMPLVAEIEIEGRHAEADGIQFTGTIQAVIRNVGLHQLRHGVHLTQRNRNVIVEGCQIYHNSGVGVLMDQLNLHQVNVIGNHISYNRLGGIRIQRSEIRNLQITGNDIEYNNDRTHGIAEDPTAEIFIDTTADGATVNEVTIASNTIQATPSARGANLRILEDGAAKGRPPGLFAITGNVIGSQTDNVYLTGCYGITLTGNCIYSAKRYNLLLENCRQIVVGSNQFRRHTEAYGTGVRLEGSSDCVLSGGHVLDETETGQESGVSLLELARCRRITVSGWQLLGAAPHCLLVEDSSDVLVSGCTMVSGSGAPQGKAAVRWTGAGSGNLLTGCRIARGSAGPLHVADASGVKQDGNLVSD